MVTPTPEMTQDKPSNTLALMLVKNSFETLAFLYHTAATKQNNTFITRACTSNKLFPTQDLHFVPTPSAGRVIKLFLKNYLYFIQ
jgi:hypothetical protein